ncbi:hypothetical protein NIES4071_41120 [Calothrix sp. NIES-4071]|nr:hypothetical protein NIES4071_41120 [Calothrix sp. NIES-4071]BAZ58428.1 hypothetical protein NIES4105_41060 [Calothrix sp. NIES-4105]
MNLPFILDVSIGLIFIYLILSLLASEIQELLATVFQWRAEHLRKSIELFLTGNATDAEQEKILRLANQIYANPLINSLNQQATGVIANLPRRFTWTVASAYRSLANTQPDKKQTVFNNEQVGDSRHSGPSYIPSNVFASSLIETLGIPTIEQSLSGTRLDSFKNQRLSEIENVIFKLQEQIGEGEEHEEFFNYLYQSYSEIQADFEQVVWNFQQNKFDLNNSISSMIVSFDRFIESLKVNLPQQETLSQPLQQLQFLKNNSLTSVESTISRTGLRPNVQEIAQAIKRGTDTYNELISRLQDKDNETLQRIESIIDKLPTSMANNIKDLAQRAEFNINNTQQGVSALRQEIEHNFDNSMERASGVYKRNAKGIALLLGLTIAAATNADAFYMVNRLSKDSALRDTITQNAGQIVLQNRDQLKYVDIDTLRSQTDEALNQIALPIGWGDANLQRQISWTSKQRRPFPIWRIITLLPGWIISGIAIAMGAPFWFDLLGKAVNVRNTGRPPASTTKTE